MEIKNWIPLDDLDPRIQSLRAFGSLHVKIPAKDKKAQKIERLRRSTGR